MREHQIQENLALCGVASATIALNVLGLESRPILQAYDRPDWNLRVPRMTQVALLAQRKKGEAELIRRSGMTLDHLAEVVQGCGAKASAHHAGQGAELADFRRAAIEALSSKEQVMLVNYGRTSLGQKGGGHFSPLAAYNAEHDMFLVYDVAPWKADPVWVRAETLFAAMATVDSDAKKNRGYLLIKAG